MSENYLNVAKLHLTSGESWLDLVRSTDDETVTIVKTISKKEWITWILLTRKYLVRLDVKGLSSKF